MISQEQWEAIRQRFMNVYRDCGDNSFNQALDDIQRLLMATKPYTLAVKMDDKFPLQGTCMACAMGVCKKDYSHT